jgi:hypothetical protein
MWTATKKSSQSTRYLCTKVVLDCTSSALLQKYQCTYIIWHKTKDISQLTEIRAYWEYMKRIIQMSNVKLKLTKICITIKIGNSLTKNKKNCKKVTGHVFFSCNRSRASFGRPRNNIYSVSFLLWKLMRLCAYK